MFLWASLSCCRILYLGYDSNTFSMLLVVKICSLVPHLLTTVDVGTVFSISFISYHSSVILISIRVLDSSLYKFIILKFAFELCPIFYLQITSSRSFIFDPLSIVRSTSKWEKPITIFLVISPLPIIILFWIVVVCSITIFHLILPRTLIYNLPSPCIHKCTLTMLFTLPKLPSIKEIVLLEKVLSSAMIFFVLKFTSIYISIWKSYLSSLYTKLNIGYWTYLLNIWFSYSRSNFITLWHCILWLTNIFFSVNICFRLVSLLVLQLFLSILQWLSWCGCFGLLYLIFRWRLQQVFFGRKSICSNWCFILESVCRRSIGNVGHWT